MEPETPFSGPARIDRTGPEPLSDAELDRFVELRLRMAGVDLSVLPEDDPSAPADRVRVMRSARNFLRNTAAALSAAELDPQLVPPVPSPAVFPFLVPEFAGSGGSAGPGSPPDPARGEDR